jgi:hypothetical protein
MARAATARTAAGLARLAPVLLHPGDRLVRAHQGDLVTRKAQPRHQQERKVGWQCLGGSLWLVSRSRWLTGRLGQGQVDQRPGQIGCPLL